MSLTGTSGASASRSFPRVSGDEPLYTIYGVVGATFSPRERG